MVGMPMEEFIQSEFPQWIKSDVYDFNSVDLVIVRPGMNINSNTGDFIMDYPWTFEALLEDFEARNVAVAMAGLNYGWDEQLGLRTVFVGSNSVTHFPYAGEPEPVVLKESIEFDGEEILMSGFDLGQPISMASPLPDYDEETNTFYNPLYYDPTSDFVTVATSVSTSGATRPTLVHHKTRPILNLPWTKDPELTNFELTEDGRQLVRNCFSWLRVARSQSNMGRRVLAEVDLVPESIQSYVLAVAVLTIAILVSVSLCASGFCKSTESVKELDDQSTEVVCTF